MNHFSIGLWCVIKSGFYMTTSDDQVSGWTEKPKHFSKPNLYQKRWKWVFGGLLSLDPLQLSESQWNHYIWEVCSANWWDAWKLHACSWHCSTERAQCCTTTLDCMSQNQRFKSWTNWATKFCLIHHIHLIPHQPTTTSSSILTTSCMENFSTTSKRQKMLSKSSLNSQSMDFYAIEKKKLFLAGKMCWL